MVSRPRLTAEQRRESILQAAIEVFAARGYRAGKVSDIAAKVGVTEPVIFQNFGSKAALYAAVIDRVARDIQTELHTLVEHHGSASDLLNHVLAPSHDHHGDHAPGAHGLLFVDAATLIAEPGLSGAARSAVGAVAGHLTEIIRRGQADGDIRAEIDPETGAWLLISVLATRPLRGAATTPNGGHLENDLTALAIQAVLTPTRKQSNTRQRRSQRS